MKTHDRLGFVIVDYYDRFLCQFPGLLVGWTSDASAAKIFSAETALLQMKWQAYRGNCVWALRVDNLPAKFSRENPLQEGAAAL